MVMLTEYQSRLDGLDVPDGEAMTLHITPQAVVVGCDGSWHSHRAVTAATREAVRRDTDLVVLSIPDVRGLRSDRLADVARSEQDALSTATGMASRGLAWAREIDPAVRARALVIPLEAPELSALLAETGLLVLGGHGRGGQRAFSLGSTSLQLAHGATAPLMLAAPDGPVGTGGRQPTVVVGLGPQPWSGHALSYAVAQAAVRRAVLVVVHAVLPGQPHLAAAVARAERDCAAALEDTATDLATVSVLVTVAPVVDALLGACTADALLVLGNRGKGRLKGPVPGSLTEKLMGAAICDVVLVPEPAGEDGTVPRSAALPQPV
jgi:nucleotide-binding universal stress UspA family protein